MITNISEFERFCTASCKGRISFAPAVGVSVFCECPGFHDAFVSGIHASAACERFHDRAVLSARSVR